MKNALIPIPVVVNGDMSADITSEAFHVQYLDNIGLQFDFTGSPVGTIEVQVSLNHTVDAQGRVKTVGTWATLPSSAFVGTYPVPGTTTSPGYLDIPLTSAAYMRVVYNATSGTGTLNVIAIGKGV